MWGLCSTAKACPKLGHTTEQSTEGNFRYLLPWPIQSPHAHVHQRMSKNLSEQWFFFKSYCWSYCCTSIISIVSTIQAFETQDVLYYSHTLLLHFNLLLLNKQLQCGKHQNQNSSLILKLKYGEKSWKNQNRLHASLCMCTELTSCVYYYVLIC